VFGTPRLTASWRRAVLAHPFAYLQHRVSASWQFFAGRTLTLELYHARDLAKMPLAGRRVFRAVVSVHDWLKAATPLFRAGFWLLLAAGVVAFAWRRRATPSGAFAIGTAGSALVYVLTYIPIGVAADFRYGYWLILATLAGGAAAFAARYDASAAAAAPDARAAS
jgi:hypothetical protein